MTTIEDRLRNAFEQEVATITEGSLRPAEPPSSSARTSGGSRWTFRPLSRWVWPAVAATALAALSIAVAVVHDGGGVEVRPVAPPPTTATHPSPTNTSPTRSGSGELSERGRRYDLVDVVSTREVATESGEHAQIVLLVHRWRIYNRSETELIPDRQIARHGFTPYAHTDQIETKLGTDFYRIPVPPDATFILNDCTGDAGGVPTRLEPHHVTAAQFLRDPRRKATVVTLDDRGRLVSARTDGGC